MQTNISASRFFHSYKGKWFVAIFSICSAMFLLLVLDRIAITRQFIYEREMNRINSVGTLLANFIGKNLLDKDTVEAKRIISSTLAQPDIELVAVLDTNGNNLFSSGKMAEARKPLFTDRGIPALKQDTYYKTFPMAYHDKNLGFLQVAYSVKKIRQNLNAALYRVLAVELILFIAILFIAWHITGVLLKPLSEMKDVSNKIAGGDFSVRVRVASKDSIGELAAALNNMARQLGDLTENMQSKIRRATQELTISNNELLKKTFQLEESNKKLMELDELKSDFVSMVSHELKTPLTSIIGFSKTLHTLDLPENQRKKYLAIIEAEGKRVAQLIEEYLDISRIESGNFPLRMEALDMEVLIQKVIESIKIAPGRIVKTALPFDLPLVRGDAERIRRVIINLLENALKYSPAGEEIIIGAHERKDDIVICIKDSGPGVKEEERERIFEKFYRGTDKITERTRGSGMGLAIAKGIVEAHHGTIWVESGPGEGSTFCFSLSK